MGDDDGFVAGFEALAFGVLVFVVGTLLLLNAWAVVDATFAASAAAREAVRAVVEEARAPVTTSGGALPDTAVLEALALTAARQAVEAHGYPGASLRLAVRSPGGVLTAERCASVRIEAALDVPVIILPSVTTPGPRTAVSAHEEVVDPLRAGLEAREGLERLPDEGNACGF